MLSNDTSDSGAMLVLDAYTAIDLDRTILRSTTLFYTYIIPAMKRVYGYSDAVIAEVLAEEKVSRGRAFDFVAYMNALAQTYHLEPVAVEELAQAIVAGERQTDGYIADGFIDAVLAEGSLELIDELSVRENEHWGIMTSGGELTQSLKLQIAETIIYETLELELGAEIVATERKAQTIMEEWYDQQEQLFKLPESIVGVEPLYAKKVRLLDDKLINTDVSADYVDWASNKLVTYVVQTAEELASNGLSLQEVILKIQQGD